MNAPERPNKRTTDPLGKRALFSPPTNESDQGRSSEGVRALYSTPGEWRPGTVVMECSACLAHTRVSIFDVGARILAFSIWIPGKSHSRWLSCPACDQRTWSRIRWSGWRATRDQGL
ncbi:MAG: hypothetical protein KJN63_05505 [Acidimicrobiia bacterium]|nr:hypothetical protein [Acidimicrobiia bacterium]